MKEKIENLIKDALKSVGVEPEDIHIEHPSNLKFGDYSTNVAIKYGHKDEIVKYIEDNKPAEVEKIEIAGPGFINLYLSKDFFKKSIGEIVKKGDQFGKTDVLKGQKTIVEYTDANLFKHMHIGHLMSNTIGEAVSRIIEWNGAEIKRANFQGDIGLHVAKAIWGFLNGEREKAYSTGVEAYESDENAKKEIQEINRKIYDRSDPEINKIYDTGRQASLDNFAKIYEKLGTKFDYLIFESETGPIGKQIVSENVGKIFEESEGAIIFRGEKHDPSLHTRVFINKDGLPTYEAKDLGNAKKKAELYPHDQSVVVTGNEIKDYFRVMLAAMKMIYPNLAARTKHLPHGMLRLSTGKMSSRTGDIITIDELIDDVKEKTEGREDVAIGAIKYMILRQSIGNDIIFDIEKSVSTEGDSGVYLQYAHARAGSLLEKAGEKGDPSADRENVHEVEKLLYRFPEVVERAMEEYAPNYITTYLTEIAAAFNNFYAHEEVISSPEAPYRLALVEAFKTVMKNGLDILGIPSPERI